MKEAIQGGVIKVIVQDDMWRNIPLIHVFDEKMNESTPVVIFLHGFLSAKEHNLHYAYQFVKKGMRVIMPDAYLHGERSKGLNEMQMNIDFWKIVLSSIKEVNTIYEELVARGLLASNKIGLAGTSMGGIVTSGCLKKYDWIRTAAICMGAPGYNELADYQMKQIEAKGIKLPITSKQKEQIQQSLAEYDITNEPEAFKNRPVLFYHGKKDKVVPFQPTFDFYLKLRSYYEQSPKSLKFIEEPREGHKVNRNGVLAVTDWLAQHLAVKVSL